MLKKMMKSVLVVGAMTVASGAFAQASPVGLWKTIDDDGKTEKSLVRIAEDGGVLTGKIEKVFDVTKQDARCDKCSDDRKDKPMLGFPVIRNVKAANDGVWSGGDITDPNNGKVYKVKIKPVDEGKKLEVRGYIGFSLLGRTQTWVRVE